MSVTVNSDIRNIIHFLSTQGYQFKGIDYNPRFGASARAKFEKTSGMDEINGNYVNDSSIEVTVDFDHRYDYKNGVEDEEEGMVYDYDATKADAFIRSLIAGTYGGRKSKGKRSAKRSRKSRKHRKK